jgi:lipoprotein-anchoring transpeptidase ErfK/SrfK
MQRIAIALALSALGMVSAFAQPVSLNPNYDAPGAVQPLPQQVTYRQQGNLGGGFIEFLFGGGEARGQQPPMVVRGEPPVMRPMAEPPLLQEQGEPQPAMTYADPAAGGAPARPAMDPRYMKQVVDYRGPEKPGTIVIDTPNRFLFLVQEDGKALRYGIGVGRPGFSWAGVKTISAKREWPDWRPPEEMLQRRPDLPRYMAGGPENPLGARAMYLGSSLYRIHGSNEPWTIGQAVSSGCIRMRNEDVVDLYERVKVGTKVLVI